VGGTSEPPSGIYWQETGRHELFAGWCKVDADERTRSPEDRTAQKPPRVMRRPSSEDRFETPRTVNRLVAVRDHSPDPGGFVRTSGTNPPRPTETRSQSNQPGPWSSGRSSRARHRASRPIGQSRRSRRARHVEAHQPAVLAVRRTVAFVRPRVARHGGYGTVFPDMHDVKLSRDRASSITAAPPDRARPTSSCHVD
jgi:hypothetical protein